jgi:hypothetical protein
VAQPGPSRFMSATRMYSTPVSMPAASHGFAGHATLQPRDIKRCAKWCHTGDTNLHLADFRTAFADTVRRSIAYNRRC